MLLRKTIYLINMDNKKAWMKLLSKRPEIAKFLSELPDGIDSRQLKVIRKGFTSGWSVKEMKMFVEKYGERAEKEFEICFFYENLIKKCEWPSTFSRKQYDVILAGFENNLSDKQVEIYAKPEFASFQMQEILWALERGIDSDIVKKYADKKFEALDMREIFKGFNNGLDMSQVDIYAQPDIPYKIKRKMRCLLEYGISKEDVSLCISDKFNLDQVYEIAMGFEFGLSRAQVEKYADSKYSADEMEKIRLELEKEEMLAKVKLSDNEELFDLLDV